MFLTALFFIIACQPETDPGVFEATPVEGRKMILVLLDGTASDDTVYRVDIVGAESFTGRANQPELWLDYEGVRMDSGVLPSYPEDLYWDGRGIWTCTEKPSNRYCVQMSLSHLSSHWEA